MSAGKATDAILVKERNGHSKRQNSEREEVGIARDLAPVTAWSTMNEREHFVQFYESDEFLLESLGAFVKIGLRSGQGVIIVAETPHRIALEELLLRAGFDVPEKCDSGQLVLWDAAEALALFMTGDCPNEVVFVDVFGGLIKRTAARWGRVRVFGEMVARLWKERNYDGAIRLEQMWNQLQCAHPFQLSCAYPMSGFGDDSSITHIAEVCAKHSRVIPAESYTRLDDPDERLRTIISLQQQAQRLRAEIAERKQTEDVLRAVRDQLETQVKDLQGLHEMSSNLASTLDMESLLNEVLRAAMAVHGTGMGLLSLSDSESGFLKAKVSHGFNEEFLNLVDSLPFGSGACGQCYEQRRRIVVEDVEVDPIFAQYRLTAKLGGFRACHCTPLLTRDGNMIGVLSVYFRKTHCPSDRESRLMDLYARMAAEIIENARLHQQVQQRLAEREELLMNERIARAEAESLSRLKDEFLATVSHELRTPLNAIIGWIHMLRAGKLDESTAVRALETVERNARSQAQLIEDILDVSRVITGKLRLNMGSVDMAAVINEAIDSVQLAANSKGIKLAVVLDPTTRHVPGDSSRLQQVIWNVLANAIKFTPSGGRVEIRLEREGSHMKVHVKDTGQGVSADFLPYMFDRFRQADGTTTRSHGGLGLGLAIVRHLVELHGGTVQCHSAGKGCGSTFTVSLPMAVDQKPPGSPEGLAVDVENPNSLFNPASLENVQVLIVDDNKDTLQMLTVTLTEYKAQVQTAASAAEALEVLEWFRPDVMVSDLAMPEEDGYSLIGKVRARENGTGKQVPAVALTSYVRVDDRARALSAGFNMFVPKPVEPKELITAIANLAGSSC